MAKAQGSGEDAYIVIEKTYSKAEGAVAEDQVVFNNSYEPKPIVLPGEGESAVQGRKTLVGRDSLVDEEFSFTLSAANTAARTGLKKISLSSMEIRNMFVPYKLYRLKYKFRLHY